MRLLSTAAVVVSLGLAACSGKGGGGAGDTGASGSPGSAGGASGGKQIVIGFSMDTLKEERWQRDRDEVVAAAQKMGAKVLVQAANGNDALQNSQAENLLTQGIPPLTNGRLAWCAYRRLSCSTQ